ncbi:MAG: M48 family metalloprotease [Hydrogenophilaceae bacterium]|nr:M48 family metalloprotease [Hydrogenophilaceae bacterium]
MSLAARNRVVRRIAIAVAGALLLTHCAKNPVSGDKDFVLMSEQQEIQMGAQAHKDVLQEYGVLDNPQLQAYVTRVGKALAAKSHRPHLDWHFTVVDSPEVNAFALPGGYIYITRGIMAYLNSEAELAGVMGHEIGHVTARHGVRQQSAATAAGLGAILGSILIPGMDNQAGATLLQQLTQSLVAGYGREHELESDRLGAEYLAKTAYNPQAMVEVIGVLKNQELYDIELAKKEGREPRRYHGLFDTHPSNDTRLKQVVGEANKYKVANPREGREEFIQAMNGVYFGDSPDQGVIRSNALLHEKLGIAVQFPQGWRVQNQSDRVVAINPQSTAMVELKQGPKNAQPIDTLQKNLKLDKGARYEEGSINGNPAAFAAGAKQGKPVLVAAINFNNAQYLLAGMAKDGATYNQNRNAMKSSINSFRALSQQERNLARPHVIRVIQAQPGMTMASLAMQSPLGASAEPQLRLMNDLYPSGEPKPGQLIKIVQ